MSDELDEIVGVLRDGLARLERQIREAEGSGKRRESPVRAGPPLESLAHLPALPASAELSTRLDIRFIELVQNRVADIVAQNLAPRMLQQEGEGKGPLIDVTGVKITLKGADEININVATPPADPALAPGATVVKCRALTDPDFKQEIGYQGTGMATESYWFNQEEAVIPGLKERVKKKAEENAKRNALTKANEEARRAVCSGTCEQGICPTIPAALIGLPKVVASDATYDDSGLGSVVTGTATAQCTVTYVCPCI